MYSIDKRSDAHRLEAVCGQNLSSATDQELLESIIPPSAVKELMADYGSVSHLFCNIHSDELHKIPGIGPIKAKQLTYICELAKRIYRASNIIPISIKTPMDAVDVMVDIKYLAVEQVRAIYLGTKSGIIGTRILSQGTINSAIISPREIFSVAVKLMAASVILIHNHPSGDPTPSQEDIALTKKVSEAGKVLDIALLDHVIIAESGYVSLKEKGLI